MHIISQFSVGEVVAARQVQIVEADHEHANEVADAKPHEQLSCVVYVQAL